MDLSLTPSGLEHHIKGKDLTELECLLENVMDGANWLYCCDVKQFDSSHSEYIKPLEAGLLELLCGRDYGKVLRSGLREHYTIRLAYCLIKMHPMNNSGNKRTSELNGILNQAIIQATELVKNGSMWFSEFLVEGDDSFVATTSYDSRRSFVPRCLGMECED